MELVWHGCTHSTEGVSLSVHSPLCVYNYSAILSLEILNPYWDSLPFRGGSNFSLRINWKRIKRIEQVSLRGWVQCSYQPHQCLQWM